MCEAPSLKDHGPTSQLVSVASPWKDSSGLRQHETSALFQIQALKVGTSTVKDKGCRAGGESRNQTGDSARIHGKPGLYWEHLKLSFVVFGGLIPSF